MAEITESASIPGVKFVKINAFGDDRGQFMETFRTEWFPERTWNIIQANRSDSVAGVLRGLHYHFKQIDYWYVPRGRILVGLADLRRSSPACGISQVVEIGDNNNMGIFIPSGVAHGFLALTDVTLTYLVDQYYDGADELGVAWDDPQLNVPWGSHAPVLSDRDLANPLWKDIPEGLLPQ